MQHISVGYVGLESASKKQVAFNTVLQNCDEFLDLNHGLTPISWSFK